MARRNAGMGVSCVGFGMLVVMMVMGRPAAAQAPAPSVDCTAVALTLTDCLGFVTGSDKSPPDACCKELKSVVNSNPQCLCLLFNTTFTDPLGVNITLAQELPTKCKVQTPPTSLCALVGVPVPGPASSPSPGLAVSPAAKSPVSPSLAPTPSKEASPTPTAAAPSGTTAPTGSPALNVSSVAPSPPNSAHSISSRSVGGAAASLLLLVAIFLS